MTVQFFDDIDVTSIWPWQKVEPADTILVQPDFADNEELKKLFGVALGKDLEPFPAGLELFPAETSKALWISVHWINDPVVIASRDAYRKTLKASERPLDREQFLAEVLNAARFADEDRDRAAFFKLYAETAGFIGKVAETINNNTVNQNNFMTVKFVRPDKSIQTIEALNTESKIQNEVTSPIKLKLVGGASR